ARAQLLQTATVIDAANPGLAGKLGRGRVNAGAALTIAAVPKFIVTGHQIADQDGAPLAVGAANNLVVELRNDWLDATSVTATLSTADAGVTITKPSAGFGAIPSGGSVANAGDPFQVTIAAGAYGRAITFGLSLVADGKTSNVSFTVNTESVVATLPATISTDTTLTNDRVWLAANSVKVNAGVTLTIQPGTTIKFAAGKYLLVEGTLIADGTPEQPITFTAAGDPVEPGGHWGGCHVSVCGGIIFGPEGNSASYDAHGQYLAGSIVRNCVLEHSEGGLVAWGAAPYVASNVLRYNIGSLGVALTSYVDIAVEGNRITHNFGGGYVVQVLAGHARVHGNLIAKNDGGVMVNCATGSHELIDNSLSGNRGTGCGTQYGLICVQGIHPPVMYGNNLVGNSAAFDIVMGTDAATSVETSAQGNFWGTTDEPAIQSRIYDSHHDFSAPTFTFTPFLTEPSLDAPPFLHNLTVSPDSPVGLEQAGFTLRFSAPMNQGVEPEVSFVSAKAGTSDYYGTLFPDADWGTVWAVALGRDGSTWIATESALLNVSGPTWAAYDYRAIGFPSECGPYVTGVDVDSDGVVWALFNNCLARHHGNSWELVPVEHPRDFSGIYIDDAGTKWLTTQWVGVQRYDGSRWASFDSSNSGLPSDGVNSIAFDGHGGTWFATEWGAARFDGTVWTVYDKYNSPLPDNQIKSVAVDASGAIWLATPGGLVRLSDGKWSTYDMFKDVLAMDALADGTVWFGGPGVVRRLEGSKWTTYANNLDCQFDLEADPAGNIWCAGVGAGVIWSDAIHPVTDISRWLDDRTWQATYDITSLVPRGEYVISVSGARGLDGMEVPADERFTFTVDYAGAVSDGTPPAAPSLYASGVAGDASAVYARWSAADPDSAITLYRYAIGTSEGATDIVSWTETTATSLNRSGLGLVDGRRYWLGVQARDSGGLWSDPTWLAFTAGEVSAGNVYLPLATK
ncbi:MAG: hypothetical protein GX601_04070, partial [Anaerolineales bacterium]|nr:hypothetical protein [Anaerolineales bacterium]